MANRNEPVEVCYNCKHWDSDDAEGMFWGMCNAPDHNYATEVIDFCDDWEDVDME